MRIVENRVAYIDLDSDESTARSPIDHLYDAVNLFNPYLGGIRYDPEEKRLYVTCTLDRDHRILDVLLGNLLGTRPIDVVDCQHGVFRGCHGETVEISHALGMLPQISVEMSVDELEMWDRDEPDLRAYNLSELPTYMMGRVRRTIHGFGSTDGKQKGKAAPLTWDDIHVHNVSLIMDWSEHFEDLDRHTLSLHLTIHRDGRMSAKQIVVFAESMYGADPASPEIIDNFSGRVRFSEPDADVPYLAAFGMRSGDAEPDRPTVPVKFVFGKDMEVWMSGPKLEDVTYVDAMIKLPTRSSDPDEDPHSADREPAEALRYRLYYEGRIRLGE